MSGVDNVIPRVIINIHLVLLRVRQQVLLDFPDAHHPPLTAQLGALLIRGGDDPDLNLVRLVIGGVDRCHGLDSHLVITALALLA
jgi:hypothetical protein